MITSTITIRCSFHAAMVQLGAQCVAGEVEVSLEDRRRGRAVRGRTGVVELVVLLVGDVDGRRHGSAGRSGRRPATASRSRRSISSVRPGPQHLPVEVPVGRRELDVAGPLLGGDRARRRRPSRRRGRRRASHPTARCGDRWLDDPTQVVDLVELLERDAGGDGAPSGNVDDEPFGLEPVDRLADRDVRDAEVLLELADVDPSARFDVAEEDPFAQLGLDDVLDRAGGRRRRRCRARGGRAVMSPLLVRRRSR